MFTLCIFKHLSFKPSPSPLQNFNPMDFFIFFPIIVIILHLIKFICQLPWHKCHVLYKDYPIYISECAYHVGFFFFSICCWGNYESERSAQYVTGCRTQIQVPLMHSPLSPTSSLITLVPETPNLFISYLEAYKCPRKLVSWRHNRNPSSASSYPSIADQSRRRYIISFLWVKCQGG